MDDLGEAGGHCPRCGAEYAPGYRVSADDRTPLLPGPAVPEAPNAPQTPMAPSPPQVWRSVAAFGNQDEARLLAGRLEAEGIETRIFPEPGLAIYGRDTAAMLGQPTQVLVDQGDVAEAERILREVTER